MAELQQRLEKLLLRLDRMGMSVEQALSDALRAVNDADVQAGQLVNQQDSEIDREEVCIEQECIRLFALYQPTAIDMRTLCTVIKVNNDLERIADLAASIGKRVKHVAEDEINFEQYPDFDTMARIASDILSRTVRMLNAADTTTAYSVIESDDDLDLSYSKFVRSVLDTEGKQLGGVQTAMTLINLAKALERIGDLCTNIAEDIIFLRTGNIVRHSETMENQPDYRPSS